MANGFLGIPFLVWGIVCLGIAVVYFFAWPKPKAGDPPRSIWAQFVLRWFHPLVWIVLAVVCFLLASGISNLVEPLALAALLMYAVFVITLARERISRRRAP